MATGLEINKINKAEALLSLTDRTSGFYLLPVFHTLDEELFPKLLHAHAAYPWVEYPYRPPLFTNRPSLRNCFLAAICLSLFGERIVNQSEVGRVAVRYCKAV